MFEAQVAQGVMWKKVVESIKELVEEANLQTTPAGIGIQAMDSAHVALVALSLMKSGFSLYECERNAMLGINLGHLSKILKTTENSDIITLRHTDDSDQLSVVAESPDRSKTSEFLIKLMEIEAETMSIPDMDYTTTVTMGSADFAKICRDMNIFGDTITIEVLRDGVKFSAANEIGEGFVFLRSGATADATVKREMKSEVKREVKREQTDDEPYVKKESTTAAPATSNGTKAQGGEQVTIAMSEPVSLSFALRYFTIFSKASTLATRVTLSLSAEAPCMVQFEIEGLGHLRFYLAPKVEEE